MSRNNFAAVVLALVAPFATASIEIPEPAKPETFTSPSGACRLRIVPGSRYGMGHATYELACGGRRVWTKELRYTLEEAVVADDGTAAGYAYADGDFLVAVIDPAGVVRNEERTPRVDSNYLHVDADPKASAVFLQPALGRVVVRVHDPDLNAQVERWWKYSLADGKRIATTTPKTHMAGVRMVLDARALAGSELTLVHWYRYEHAESAPGATFALVEADDKPVWTLELPDDYTGVDSPWDIGPVLLDTKSPGRFAIRHYAKKLRVEYVVAKDAGASAGWTVTESKRTPYAPPPPPPTAEQRLGAAPVATLQERGTIVIDAPLAAKPVVRDVREFAIDDRGRIGFLTGCNCSAEKPALVLVDERGKLVRRIALPFEPASGDETHATWIGGERWLVTHSRHGEGDDLTNAWRIDASNGRAAAAPGFAAPRIDALVARGDGGAIALATLDSKYTMEDRLLAFAADGNALWRVEDGQPGGTGLFSAEDVTVTTNGAVVVLENVSDDLKVYSRDGAHEQTIDLARAWGREPSYPSDIAADAAGGVVIHDFDGHPAVVRMTLDGTVVQAFDPKHADGGAVEFVDLAVAADGRIWLSDVDRLLRLDEHGVVDRVLGGDAPGRTALGDVAALFAAPAGGWIAVDSGNGALHVFDAAGAPLRVCLPSSEAVDRHLYDPHVVALADGSIIARIEGDETRYAPDCSRSGESKDARRWYPRPGNDARWVIDRQALKLVQEGRVERTIEHAPDGEWLDALGVAAVAPDGALAVVAGWPKARLFVYAANGAGVAAWELPPRTLAMAGRVAFDGERIALIVGEAAKPHRSHVVITDVRGEPQLRVAIDDPGQQSANVFLAGDELRVFDGKRTITRYALPE